MTLTRTLARIAVVGIAITSFAACSSSSDSSKSDAKKIAESVRATAKKDLEKAAKEAEAKAKADATSTTTAAPAAATPPCTKEAAAPAVAPDTVDSVYCADGYLAGDANNQYVDYAFLAVPDGDHWTRASDALLSEVCGANPNHLAQELVNDACND